MAAKELIWETPTMTMALQDLGPHPAQQALQTMAPQEPGEEQVDQQLLLTKMVAQEADQPLLRTMALKELI